MTVADWDWPLRTCCELMIIFWCTIKPKTVVKAITTWDINKLIGFLNNQKQLSGDSEGPIIVGQLFQIYNIKLELKISKQTSGNNVKVKVNIHHSTIKYLSLY